MVRVITAANPMEARIIAARLGAEGIVWEFQGSVDGPLAIGPVDVLVDEDGLESARELLHVDEIEAALTATGQPAYVTTGRDVVWAAIALLALLLFAIARMTARV